jgi:hypothetical protein
MSRRHYQCLDLYCCLPNEFSISYPQPQLSLYCQKRKRKAHRNTNALELTSSLRLSKCKSKNPVHPYRTSKDHRTSETHRRRMTNRIMSIESPDYEVEFYMVKEATMNIKRHHSSQMADGDKKTENTFDLYDEFQQQRFTNNQEHIIDLIHTDIIRPIPCKPTVNDRLKQPSVSRIKKRICIFIKGISLGFYKIKLLNHAEPSSLNHDISTNIQAQNSSNVPSLQEIEEFQPMSEIVSPSQVPSILFNDILSSFFPTPLTSTSNTNPFIFDSQQDIIKTSYTTEFLIIGQPPPPSLIESIEELCMLIRKLLQHELTEQKITSLQTTIANQLAILLTHLPMPNNEKMMKDTIQRMTSTDESDFPPLISTIGTQTDIEWTNQISKSVLTPPKQEELINTPPSSKKVTSQTELMSASGTNIK